MNDFFLLRSSWFCQHRRAHDTRTSRPPAVAFSAWDPLL